MIINSYPKIYAIGHPAIADMFNDPVIIEEKIDGSQFSFGVYSGELKARSRNSEINLDAPEKMFSKGIEVIKGLKDKLLPEWTYRGEYLRSPKHNTLVYERHPNNHIILFDLMSPNVEDYVSREDLEKEAQRLGLECVPVLYKGEVSKPEDIQKLLETKSILGDVYVEGIVVKNHKRFGKDGKPLFGKYVSEAFKEAHTTRWGKANPSSKDIKQELIDAYRLEARWNKAVFRLRDQGLLENSPKDIGLLAKEIPSDIRSECEEEIKEVLFKHFWKDIQRGVIRGMPEWYKNQLLEGQFKNEEE
jgi:hypothetical protein